MRSCYFPDGNEAFDFSEKGKPQSMDIQTLSSQQNQCSVC